MGTIQLGPGYSWTGPDPSGLSAALSKLNPTNWDLSTDQDRLNQQRAGLLNQQGAAAAGFANTAQYGYNQDTADLASTRNFLQGLASGQNSISAEQLRQGLQQNLATQRSFAASANPNDQAMAARNAAMNMAQLNYGASGQQAIAGLAERQQAQQALSQLLLQQRGQDVQGFLGANQNAIGAYGTPAQPSTANNYIMGGISGAAGYLGAKSDRRLKTEIESGDQAAEHVLRKLPRAYVYRYKDKKYGDGKRLGVMAQDLERAGLGHAVIDEPDGKAIHGGHLSTANTALIGALAKRVEKLESKR